MIALEPRANDIATGFVYQRRALEAQAHAFCLDGL
jgi:hypothetical protein